MAEMSQRGYSQAWTMIFETAYKNACERERTAAATL